MGEPIRETLRDSKKLREREMGKPVSETDCERCLV